MFPRKLVEGFVGVEGVDDVVPVAPGLFGKNAVGGAHHVRVAREIEPVPRPTFSKSPGSQQAVHDLFRGVGSIVPDERCDFLWAWRQAREVQMNTAQPCITIRIVHGLESGGLKLRQNKLIHRIQRPLGRFHRLRALIPHRLKGPELAPFLQIDGALFGAGFSGAGIHRAGLHPLFKNADFCGGKFLLWRHLKI